MTENSSEEAPSTRIHHSARSLLQYLHVSTQTTFHTLRWPLTSMSRPVAVSRSLYQIFKCGGCLCGDLNLNCEDDRGGGGGGVRGGRANRKEMKEECQEPRGLYDIGRLKRWER